MFWERRTLGVTKKSGPVATGFALTTHGRLVIPFENRNACFKIWTFPRATKLQLPGQARRPLGAHPWSKEKRGILCYSINRLFRQSDCQNWPRLNETCFFRRRRDFWNRVANRHIQSSRFVVAGVRRWRAEAWTRANDAWRYERQGLEVRDRRLLLDLCRLWWQGPAVDGDGVSPERRRRGTEKNERRPAEGAAEPADPSRSKALTRCVVGSGRPLFLLVCLAAYLCLSASLYAERLLNFTVTILASRMGKRYLRIEWDGVNRGGGSWGKKLDRAKWRHWARWWGERAWNTIASWESKRSSGG